MIERVSELPFWGPEEQIRKFINQHESDLLWEMSIQSIDDDTTVQLMEYEKEKGAGYEPQTRFEDILHRLSIQGANIDLNPEPETCQAWGEAYRNLTDDQKTSAEAKYKELDAKYRVSQKAITQGRVGNLDDIFQKQLIWSYSQSGVGDAYFYWDWCPVGEESSGDLWQMVVWPEYQTNKTRDIDRTFDYRKMRGYMNTGTRDEMVQVYSANEDAHTRENNDDDNPLTLDIKTLRHNIGCSLIEVSEWLGEGATQYGSHNGYVSRKMSLRWLFDAIRALINWKADNSDKWAEVDIHPLTFGGNDGINERFGGISTQGENYTWDEQSLNQIGGCCQVQQQKRSRHPDVNGVLNVRGNEFHYGERAYFWTHNSFVGECRFFHNVKFLGQTTFDKEINGTAMRTRWADLAEFKESDANYSPGTLVMFGGSKEITLSKSGVCHAIVTSKPGVVLNSGTVDDGRIMVGIALAGTVPVRVVGNVCKFDKLVASSRHPGMAKKKGLFDIFKRPIGIAMKDCQDGGLVDCVTRLEF